MKVYSVDGIPQKVSNLYFEDVTTLRKLSKKFREGKKNYVVKVRYIQLNMQYRRIKNLEKIQNPRVYWPAIFHAIKQFNCTPSSVDFISDCTITFLDKLLAIGCSDANTVERILKLYGYHCCVNLRHNNLDYGGEVSEQFDYVLSIFHNDSICNCGHKDKVTHFDEDLLEAALRENDLKFMTALLKYGINISCSASLCHTIETDLIGFWTLWLYPVGVTRASIYSDEVWKNVCNSIKEKKRDYQRLFLITQMLRILNIKWCAGNFDPDLCPVYYTHKYFCASVQCMKLYLRATVEPLISKDNIVKFISSFWSDVPEAFLSRVAQDYEELFPEESKAPYSPRTLQHLCRYSLRQSLTEKKAAVLPELVENLFLPKRLKRYLLCEH